MLKPIQRLFPIALVAALAACGGGGSALSPGGALPAQSGSASAVPIKSIQALTSTQDEYSQAVMASAPLAYYRLDDTTSVATDASGHNLSGTIGSSIVKSVPPLTTYGSAMTFPGLQTNAGRIAVAANAILQPSSAVSLEALVKFAATPLTYTPIASYGSRLGSGSYELYFKNGQIVGQVSTSTGLVDVVSPSTLATNTTYAIVLTYNGTAATLSVNGKAVASLAKTGTISYASGSAFSIGDDTSMTVPAFKGTIDDVAVYGTALSATTIAQHYADVTALVTPSPSPTPSPTPTPAPTATPTPTPTATPAITSNVATYEGCPVFTAGDYYNANVASASVDPNSAAYIGAVYSTGDTAGFYASTGVEKTNLANNSTPLVAVQQQVSYHTFPVLYPWLSSYYISPLSDHHAVVVQTQSCHVYEAYGTKYSSGILSAYSGANWDLTKAFVPMSPGTPSAMASGLSLFAGAVKWEDYQSGSIRHALNWGGIAHTVAAYKFVRPASDTDWLAFNGGSLPQLPYGAHLRLKASFSTAGWGPQATMVAQAMKTYGIYLADTGSSGNALYFMNAADGSNPWNGSDLSALGKIHITDFDVLTLPTIQTVPGH